MGTAIIKMKIMPNSPDANLNAIEEKAKEIIKSSSNSEIKTEKEPIAFGLNAIILTFTWNEDKSVDEINNKLKEIPEVSSAEVIDFRRAFG